MCTLVLLFRPDDAWPLLVAANRDEMRDRPWSAPGRHWADRPDVVAGFDRLGGGSWLGVNDHGVVAAVMNREGALGPAPGMRSRGELVLEALDHAVAGEAVRALVDLDPRAYRAFNLFLGDPVSAHWLRSPGEGAAVEALAIPPGLHMLTARELDDPQVPRIQTYLPRFRVARMPDPDRGMWGAWPSLLAERGPDLGQDPQGAMNLELEGGFGTVCSQLVAIPRHPGFGRRVVFLFAGGPPHEAPFEPVDG